MTVTDEIERPAPGPVPAPDDRGPDHRGSWIPNWRMITTRFMELRRRRGLMIGLVAVNIGIPVVFLAVRLISHAVAPRSYGPAGGYSIFTVLVAGFMYVFGFIVAATVGCTAGSVDLSEGMFRHLVITGRSRLALYLARIPAGLAIVLPIVVAGFAVVCVVCLLAAPTQLNYDGVNVPAGLSRAGLDSWAADHAEEVLCSFNFNGPINVAVPCAGPGGSPDQAFRGPGGATAPTPTAAQVRAAAVQVANQNYAAYHSNFLSPPVPLMIDTGLWIMLEATIGFVVGLGLSSLMGQRTLPVILLVVLELILTPILSRHVITHLLNAQRGIVGAAMAHIEPGGLPAPFSGGNGNGPNGGTMLIPESRTVAVCVIVAWLVVWTALGAWRMMTRDA